MFSLLLCALILMEPHGSHIPEFIGVSVDQLTCDVSLFPFHLESLGNHDLVPL